MKKMSFVFALIVACGVCSACNTVQGFGKDVEKVGGKISGK